LAARPTLLLLAGPQAQRQVLTHDLSAWPLLRCQALPWLTQRGFDELLWASDLNFVRGEDSLVRAIWAGNPFVWQAYPQQDDAHHRKVQALLGCWQNSLAASRTEPLAPGTLDLWQRWNGGDAALANQPDLTEPALATWRRQVQAWRQQLLGMPSLSEQLLDFVNSKLLSPGPATARI
jgi:uncharacterized repeat protein (TIGR03837 family)